MAERGSRGLLRKMGESVGFNGGNDDGEAEGEAEAENGEDEKE